MKMKAIISFGLFLLITLSARAQGVVNWSFSAKKTGDKTYEVHLTAQVDEPWHIYSQSSPKGGPLATTISFLKNPLVVPTGNIREKGDLEIYHDEIFDVDVYSYTRQVDFIQLVKLKTNVKTNLSGTVEFMACTKQQCLTPKTVKFTVKLQ